MALPNTGIVKVLIIGGNRYFGKRLTALLLDRKAEVTLLNRGLRLDEFDDRVRRIHLSRKELAKDHPLVRDERWDIIYDQVCYDSFEAEKACNTFQGRTHRYVFTSSQSVYGPGSAIAESSFDSRLYSFQNAIVRAQMKDAEYGEAKRQAEATFQRVADFPVAAVRFPIVLGEDDHDRRLHFHVQSMLEKKPIYFPNLDARISFISSADAAGFLASLADSYRAGPINCCSADTISLRQFVSVLEGVLGVKAIMATTPEEGAFSPFGIENDWYMDAQALSGYSYQPKPILTWLPKMVSNIAAVD